MEPTLKNGQVVWVNHWYYLINKIRVGDIAAYEFQGKLLIKRIKEVKREKVFFLGDNSNDSFDSRQFGYVDKKEVLGKVLIKSA